MFCEGDEQIHVFHIFVTTISLSRFYLMFSSVGINIVWDAYATRSKFCLFNADTRLNRIDRYIWTIHSYINKKCVLIIHTYTIYSKPCKIPSHNRSEISDSYSKWLDAREQLYFSIQWISSFWKTICNEICFSILSFYEIGE